MGMMFRVGASGGLLYSGDTGATWSAWATPVGFGTTQINSVAYNQLGYIIAVANSNFARRSEGGEWTELLPGMDSGRNVTAIGAGYSKFNIAGSSGALAPRVRSSTNNGTSWTTRTISGATHPISDIQQVTADTWCLLSAAGIHRSTDDGTIWGAPATPLSSGTLVRLAAMASTVVAVGTAAGVGLKCAKSTDAGATWTEFTLDSTSEGKPAVATNGWGAWCIASGNKIFRSTDNGVTWAERILTGVDAGTSWAGMECWGGTWVVSPASTANIWRSTDNGKTWAEVAGSGSSFAVVGTGHVKAEILRASEPTLNPDEPPAPPSYTKAWLVVGSSGAIHRSVDNGTTWTVPSIGTFTGAITSVASDDLGRWILSGSFAQMRRSIDNGVTWVAIDQDFGGSGVRGLAASGAGVWVAACGDGKLARSADHGQTWNLIAHGISEIATASVNAIATDRAGVWVAVTSNLRVLRSTDNGLTWAVQSPLITTGVGWRAVATDRAGVWVITGDVPHKELRSTDNGATWVELNTGYSDASSMMGSSAATDRAGVWHLGWSLGIIERSTNNMSTSDFFTDLGLSVSHELTAIDTDTDGTWIVGSNLGTTHRSTNNGASWAAITIPSGPSDIRAIAAGTLAESEPVDPPPDGPVDPEPEPDANVWIAAGDSGKVRRSVNHGVTWAAVDAGFATESVFAAAADAAGVVLVGGEDGEMRRSTNQGATWATVDPGFGVSDIRGIATDRHGVWVAVGTAGKIARSEDSGATWSPITTSLGSSADFEAVATNRTGVWVAVGRFGDLILSTNNGASWVTVDSGFTEDIHAVAYRSGVWVAAGFGGQIRRSVNNGLVWSEVGDAVGILRAVAASGSAWVVAGWLGEMLRSTDAGATWATIDSDFGTAGVNALAAAPDGVWVSGGDDALFLRRSNDDGATWDPVDGEFDGGDFVHALCYIPESMMDFDEDVDLESIASGDDEYEHDGDAHFLLSEGEGLPEEIFISSTATLYSNGSSSDFTVVATVKDLTSEAAATDEISEFSTYTLESAGTADDEISSTTDSVHDLLSEASGLGTVSEYHALDLLSEATATDEISEEAVHDLLSEATADDEISGFAASFEDLLSAALADDELFAGGTTTVNVDEAAFGDSETFFHNPGAVAWVLNTESNGVSWYSNYHFTGMTQVGDRVLMVGPMGLCEVTGNLDIDDDIQANVTYGFVDFGDEQKKRIDRLNFGYTADGLLQATVETYGQGYPAYTYEMEARTAEMPRNNRIRPGKGLNARYWRIGIENVDGCAFSVEDISADIVPSARRL